MMPGLPVCDGQLDSAGASWTSDAPPTPGTDYQVSAAVADSDRTVTTLHGSFVTADGSRPVATQVFDSASAYLDSDTVFGVKQSLIRAFVPGDDGALVRQQDVTLAVLDG